MDEQWQEGECCTNGGEDRGGTPTLAERLGMSCGVRLRWNGFPGVEGVRDVSVNLPLERRLPQVPFSDGQQEACIAAVEGAGFGASALLRPWKFADTTSRTSLLNVVKSRWRLPSPSPSFSSDGAG